MKRNLLTCKVLVALIAAALLAPATAGAWEKIYPAGKTISSTQLKENAKKMRSRSGRTMNKPGMEDSGHGGTFKVPTAEKAPNYLTRSAEDRRGNFYAVVPQHAQLVAQEQAFLGKIDAKTGKLTPAYYGAHYRSDDYEFQSGVTIGNTLYLPSVESTVFNFAVRWFVVDLDSGSLLRTIDFDGNEIASPYTMTYDPTTNKIYGLSLSDGGNTVSQLVVIDPETYTVDLLRDLKSYGFLNAICYNPLDGEIYIFNENNLAYILNRTNGTIVEGASLTTEDNSPLFQSTYPGAITYSPLDRCFVVASQVTAAQMYYLDYIDAETFEVTRGPGISAPMGCYIASIHNTDPYAEWDAPGIPAKPVVTADKASTTTTISVTAPELAYSGVAFPAGTKLKGVLTVDDKKLLEEDFTPGETKTISQDFSAGQHEASIYFEANELASPTISTKFFTGHDNPYSPTNVRLNSNTLSWKAPREGGAHGGYVDRSALYYDVYFNNVKQNSRPITDTQYTFIQPVDMALTAISVRAVANNMESEPAMLYEIVGRARTLPMEVDFSEEGLSITKIIDGDGDGTTFTHWAPKELGFEALHMLINYYNDADEWVFFPLSKFEDATKLYKLDFNIGGLYTGVTREDLEIYLAKSFDYSKLKADDIIWQRNQMRCPLMPVEYSVNFSVPEAGDYYVAFHYCSKKANRGRGMSISGVKISATDKSADVPQGVTDIQVKPAEKGALEADIEVKLPTLNSFGQPLDAQKNLKVTFECEGVDEFDLKEGLPGSTVTGHVKALEDGFNQFFITVANDNGNGRTVVTRQYIGIDTPYSPRNVIGSPKANNRTVNIHWDEPSSVGINGGYVSPDDCTYNIFARWKSGVDAQQVGTTKTTSFDYTAQVANNEQAHYWLGVQAETVAGKSQDVHFHSEILGTPYELPMTEEYGTTHFDYYPVIRRTGDGYGGTNWSNERSLLGLEIGGNPTINAGCVLFFSEATGPCKGQIMLPKASTLGIPEVLFSAKTWDYAVAPKVYLTGRVASDPDNIIQIGEINYKKGSSGEWNEQQFILPEVFANQPWIQIFINVDFASTLNEYFVIDNYRIRQNVSYDMKISSFTGPEECSIGDKFEATLTVANSGEENNRCQANIKLYAPDGKFLDMHENRTPNLPSGRSGSFYNTFLVKPEWKDYEYITMKAEIEPIEDEVEVNNTASYKVKIVKSQLPVVNDLEAKYNDEHTAVTLNWSTPDVKHGASESFDYEVPFTPTEKIGAFRNIDMDKRKCFGIEGLTWPGIDEPQAWTVIDAKSLNLMGDPRLYPHSGNQYLMARALEYEFGVEEAPQAADWLISPEVVPGSEISFWYNRISVEQTEYVELWVSETDDHLGDAIVAGDASTPDKCGSFHKVRSFSKTGEETWEKVTYTLPKTAKYFALVYRSFDSFAALIDDISFSPVQLNEWTVDHFSVYRYLNRDWNTFEKVADNVKGNTFTHENSGDNNAIYFVTTHVNAPKGITEGPRSNEAIVYSLGVDDLTDLSGVYGGTGEIIVSGLAGQQIALYTTDGKYVRTVNVKSDSQRIPTDAGIYLVKNGNAFVKVLVK